MSLLRLGVLIPINKKVKIKLPERILTLCKEEGIEVIDLNDVEDLYSKGPFDVLFHKVTDYFNESSQEEAYLKINKVREYCSQNINMAVIDNFEESENLTDRFHQTKLMKQCEINIDGIQIFVPKVLEIAQDISASDILQIILTNGVKFPILVKPGIASITEGSHDMKLIFSRDHLKDVKTPCIIQEFCNHGGVVYKIYMVDEDIFMCERPSIMDVKNEPRESLCFDTRNISKLGKSFVPELHGNDPNQRLWRSCDDNSDLLNRNVITQLSRFIRQATNLYLLGLDILVELETGNYALIDVNHFPGYSGINEQKFLKSLVKLVKKLGTKCAPE